jgi:hypothetical protein
MIYVCLAKAGKRGCANGAARMVLPPFHMSCRDCSLNLTKTMTKKIMKQRKHFFYGH